MQVKLIIDASSDGWGALCLDIEAAGTWSPDEKKHHINFMELKAVWPDLRAFAPLVQN